MLILFLACSPGTVVLGDVERRHREESRDTGTFDTVEADADTDADSDSDSDTDADTASTPPDTGTPSPDDTGTRICDGFSLLIDRANVSSAVTEATFDVVLVGCATGISALNSGFGNERGMYLGTWTYVPSEVHGTEIATLEFTGSGLSSSGEMYFDFSSDQGDTDRFTLAVEDY